MNARSHSLVEGAEPINMAKSAGLNDDLATIFDSLRPLLSLLVIALMF